MPKKIKLALSLAQLSPSPSPSLFRQFSATICIKSAILGPDSWQFSAPKIVKLLERMYFQKGSWGSGASKLFIEIKYGYALMRLEVLVQNSLLQKKNSMVLRFLNSFFASIHIDFSITYQPKPYQKEFDFLIDQNSVGNQFCTFKLLVPKSPNYGRGRGGRVRTKSKGGHGCSDNDHNFVVFFSWLPL